MSEPTDSDSSLPHSPEDESPQPHPTDPAETTDSAQDEPSSPSEESGSEQTTEAPQVEEPATPDEPAPVEESAASAPSAESADTSEDEDDEPDPEPPAASGDDQQDEPGQQDESDQQVAPDEGDEPDQQEEPDQQDEPDEPEQPESGPWKRLPEPPVRTGVAPIVNAPTGPDQGLGGFLDTLDERAKEWWATYQIRQARKKVLAAKAAEVAQAVEAAEKKSSPPDSTTDDDAETSPAAVPPPNTPNRHRARHSSTARTSTPSASSAPQVGLPKPPPAENRPADQLFTGSIPVVPAEDASEDPPRPDHNAQDNGDQTTLLPAYRGDDSDAPPAPTDRPELDEQRRRTVIAQKAAAIEKATSEPSPAPYGGSGYIGADRRGEYSYESADDEEDLYTYIPPYNLPSRDADPEPTTWDLARRIFVSIGAVSALVSTLWMFGWFSSDGENPAILVQGGLQEAHAEGWFSGERALLSPDYNWYWIWPLITIALVIHAIYQWRPSQRSTPRQRRSGWLVGAAACMMLVLTPALYNGIFTLALVCAAVIAGALTQAVRQFNLYTARTDTERQLTDDIIGLFYGFALIQVMSMVSVWLTQRGWDIPGIPATFWALAGLLLFTWTAAFYSMTERGRITIALALAWGLFWLVFPRILAEVTSVWVALGAALGAFIVILCTQSRRYRINHAERRAAMGRPLEDII